MGSTYMSCCDEAKNRLNKSKNVKPQEILLTFANESKDENRQYGEPYKGSCLFQADEIDFSRDYQSEPEYFYH